MTLPIGTIVALVTTEPQDGWLLCDGRTIDEKYSELSQRINSHTTPNLVGRCLIGAGQPSVANEAKLPSSITQLNVGDSGGAGTHTLTKDEMPEHAHQIKGGDFGYHYRSFDGSNSDDDQKPYETSPSNYLATDEAGGGQSHNNMQPYHVVNYIIYAGND